MTHPIQIRTRTGSAGTAIVVLSLEGARSAADADRSGNSSASARSIPEHIGRTAPAHNALTLMDRRKQPPLLSVSRR